MKKLLALLLTLCLGFSGLAAAVAEDASDPSDLLPSLWKEGQIHRIEKKAVPLYIGSPETPYIEDFPVPITMWIRAWIRIM